MYREFLYVFHIRLSGRSNGSQSSKRSIRGALDFSGLFPGGNLSAKEAEAAPKLLDESEADSILWNRPSAGKFGLPPVCAFLIIRFVVSKL